MIARFPLRQLLPTPTPIRRVEPLAAEPRHEPPSGPNGIETDPGRSPEILRHAVGGLRDLVGAPGTGLFTF
jgi:hypothetical protein